MTERSLQVLAKARDRADEMLGGVAPSTRELVAIELATWWMRGGNAALVEVLERQRAQASPTKGKTREVGPESYQRKE